MADSLHGSLVVLLDSIISNIDRTAKNTNLLNWNKELWLIDHGASLYFHHNWASWESHLDRTFPLVSEHVLLSKATKLSDAVSIIKEQLSSDLITEIIDALPDDWLIEDNSPLSPAAKRQAYKQVLLSRVNKIDVLAKEAADAR